MNVEEAAQPQPSAPGARSAETGAGGVAPATSAAVGTAVGAVHDGATLYTDVPWTPPALTAAAATGGLPETFLDLAGFTEHELQEDFAAWPPAEQCELMAWWAFARELVAKACSGRKPGTASAVLPRLEARPTAKPPRTTPLRGRRVMTQAGSRSMAEETAADLAQRSDIAR
jgi:hypothetical protein